MKENLISLIKNKTVLVYNTKKSEEAFALAHTLRKYAELTYCADETYTFNETEDNFRVIENGRVILLNTEDAGDLERIFEHFGATPVFYFSGGKHE